MRKDRESKAVARSFMLMFALAFCYMGALAAALEGWDRALLMFGGLGFALLAIGVLVSIWSMIAPIRGGLK